MFQALCQKLCKHYSNFTATFPKTYLFTFPVKEVSGLSAIVLEADHCIDPTATAVQPCNLVPASMVPFNYQAFIEFLVIYVYVNTARPCRPGMLLFIIVAIFHDLQR